MNDNNFFEDLYELNFEDFLKNFMSILFSSKEYANNNNDDIDKSDIYENNNYILKKNDIKKSALSFIANNIINNTENIKLYRRIYWPLLLGIYKADNLEDLIKDIKKKRDLYIQDKEEYIIKPINLNIQKLDPQIFHPLSSDDKNPWTLKQKNQELKEEIKQDILRTYSEKKIFQNEEIREILNNILFIWAKKNPDISYKQGMNEILAIFFIVNYREHLHNNNDFYEDQNKLFYKEFSNLFDKEYIEADTYIIFDHFMNMGLKYLFTSMDEKKNSTNKNTCKTVLLHKCTYIFHKLLKNSDKLLYNHLISLSIEPQIFLLRWIRLFYCREFPIDDTVILWDNIFADSYLKNCDSHLNIDFKGDNIEIAHMICRIFPMVDYFAISMILFIRSFLLESDENYCLKRLFKYPPVENIKILIDLSFKIKQRNEKKEKHTKKEEPHIIHNNNLSKKEDIFNLTFNNNNSITGELNIHNINSNMNNNMSNNMNNNMSNNMSNNMNSNINNNMNSNINNNMINNINSNINNSRYNNNNDMKNEYMDKNNHHSNVNNLSYNKIIPNIHKINNIAYINKKLLKVIHNLNNLYTYNMINEQHYKTELQQNIFHLNEIYNELKNIQHSYDDSVSENIQLDKTNDLPSIY
ncbi:GTPase-activating protein, putative [Plasmodium sp. gorilla clade G2]|uniref:GTPase-activating protein, putative n=1 Tax=Plasmodium sp. gorilla clade G2 TaxID=880535 RepID=UPI000D216273|nr:GTPase-activating protein, putative [Plasmodium sp. gorilla clade G2]SOV19946.1 GTPase-activating protein, putative [Plasmodium sp. gorilla clade G2]